MVWIGVPPALSNRLWARLRARNAVSSFIVFSKSARCSSVKGCTSLTIIPSSGRGAYATKRGLTLMRYCNQHCVKKLLVGYLQGLLTGVGFLGAGVIIHHDMEHRVEGLTTAASVWMTAILGIAC